MTDLRALTDAFGELERRADTATATTSFEVPSRARSGRTVARLVPAATAVAVAAGLVTGAVLFLPDEAPRPDAVQPAAPSSSAAPPSSATPSSTPAASADQLTPEVLAERFRAVLGDTATFTVTETGPGAVVATAPPAPTAGSTPVTTGTVSGGKQVGAAIVGRLTAAGVTGGFDLVVYPGAPNTTVHCDSPDQADCTTTTLPDGSTMASGQSPLEGGGVTSVVNLVRSDGTVFLLHVSNRESPKGSGALLAPHPPLTTDQLVAIATSDRW